MIENSYAREKFGTAIHVMATSAESIQKRLYYAYMSFHPVQARDFKDLEARRLFEEIVNRLTAEKNDPTGKGLLSVTLEKMSDEEASAIATLICELHSIYLSN